MKKLKYLLFWLFFLGCINIVNWDYKQTVTTILNDIQTTNTKQTDLQKKQNYQKYITKINTLSSIDQKIKEALTTYLKSKITEIEKSTKNKWLWEITNINEEKIRTYWLEKHNTERVTKKLDGYTYDLQLEETATTRAQYLAKLNYSTHKRSSSDWYYNYNTIKNRFWEQWITFWKEINWNPNFSENIWRRIMSCKKSDCTDETIGSLNKVFDFFLSEKSRNGSHYKAVMSPQFKKMGVGIATNPTSKKIFIVTHYSVDF